MDLQGILGIDEDIRNGFNAIRAHFDIKADASKDASRRSSPSRRSGPRSSTSSPTRRASSSR
jgi:hypothetical protein